MLKFTDGELVLIPGLVALLPALPISVWIWRLERDRTWRLMALLALWHVTLVVALTIFPIPVGGQELYRRTRGLSEDNLVPFATILPSIYYASAKGVALLFGNLIALMPLGVYGPFLWPGLRDRKRFAVVALAFAVGIECAQFAGSWLEGFTYRVTDIDDAIMNSGGAILAFLLWPRIARDLAARFDWQGLPWPTTS